MYDLYGCKFEFEITINAEIRMVLSDSRNKPIFSVIVTDEVLPIVQEYLARIE